MDQLKDIQYLKIHRNSKLFIFTFVYIWIYLFKNYNMRLAEYFILILLCYTKYLQADRTAKQINKVYSDELRYSNEQIYLHERTKRSNQNKNQPTGHNTTVSISKPASSDADCRPFKSCERCGKREDCVWCDNVKLCKYVPQGHLFFTSKECKSKHGMWSGVRWGFCTFDYKIVAITIAAVVLVVLILLCCCLVKFCRCISDFFYYLCCCCCCSSDDSSRREERRLKRIEMQMERQSRRQELLLKLGLKTNTPYGSTQGYSIFENTPI
uniref:uncharacterized protein LOC120341539 isoform X2 n=1 Tax=Styela clava TaxID=7725 RepID=UPI00193A6A87|nr:uncharacterized protein LOC120341539 isoform X2 [Styela clava]